MASIDIERLRPAADDLRDIARAFYHFSTYIDGILRQYDAARADQPGLFQAKSADPQLPQPTQDDTDQGEKPRRSSQLGQSKHRWTVQEENAIQTLLLLAPNNIDYEGLASIISRNSGETVSIKAISHRIKDIAANRRRRLYTADGKFLRFTA